VVEDGYYGGEYSDVSPMAGIAKNSAPSLVGEMADTFKAPLAREVADVGQAIGSDEAVDDRKVVRSGSLDLVVDKAEEAAKQTRALAERTGGFVESLQVYDVGDSRKSGSVTIRVPADKFTETMEALKDLAINVESEVVNAQDVTEQYMDMEARLKNMRAEEKQYLEIMKKAEEIEDILNVTQRLSNVRGRIEQMEARLKLLKEEVEMSSIVVSLTAEGDIEIFGIHWRPMVVVRQSFRDMLESLTDYVDSLIRFVFALPALLLWLVTWGIGLLIAWRVGRVIKQKWFDKKVNSNQS